MGRKFACPLTMLMFATGSPPSTNRTLFRRELELRRPVCSLHRFRLNQICNCHKFPPMHRLIGSRPHCRDTSSPTTIAGVVTGVHPVVGSPVDSRVELPVRNAARAVTVKLPLPILTKVAVSSGNLSVPSLPLSLTVTGATLINLSSRSVNLTRPILLKRLLGEEGRGQIPLRALRSRLRLLRPAACWVTLTRCPITRPLRGGSQAGECLLSLA
jgi:hypothetical protein